MSNTAAGVDDDHSAAGDNGILVVIAEDGFDVSITARSIQDFDLTVGNDDDVHTTVG